ncbi:MAG: hypothetical protein Q8O29_19095 [Polaromonas sp.]|uniref:hypothetical protein n=1 Tax=Polaromonas sp. TaxID=1869339 RepID=UPI0027333610|nr:hypothetical protein [Polaromonas sp.]MDP2820339.1 hypothetical protein [Polaromonas sp.]
MNPSTLELEADLAVAVEYFKHDELAALLPFMHNFPMNCCQVVSALLAHALSVKYPSATVLQVHGTNPTNDQHHFWVEVNGKVIDPTAYQFETASEPFVCDAPNPLIANFPHVKKEHSDASLESFSENFQRIDAAMQAEILKRLQGKLGPIQP